MLRKRAVAQSRCVMAVPEYLVVRPVFMQADRAAGPALHQAGAILFYGGVPGLGMFLPALAWDNDENCLNTIEHAAERDRSAVKPFIDDRPAWPLTAACRPPSARGFRPRVDDVSSFRASASPGSHITHIKPR